LAYRIEISPAAERQIRKLDRSVRRRIFQKLETLKAGPHPPGSEKLSGNDGFYRVRVGDYRIIYDIQDEITTVVVLKVGHRKEIYRQ
jgi:mRNA interferase RelE/StbE